MTYKTHKQYSIAFAYISLMVLYHFKLCDFYYFLCFPVIILISQWGAKFPDLDHDFSNIRDKNVLTWTINKIIHLTGGKHRSWQTHSLDVFVLFAIGSYFLGTYLFEGKDSSLYFLIMFGFASGWFSHLFSDMLNGVGIRMVCWSKFKVALVPKSLFGLRFNTGGAWEEFNYKVMRRVDVVLGIVAVIYPMIPQIVETLEKIIN